MSYVLVTVHRGLIDDVRFFRKPEEAVRSLKASIESMNLEDEDAAIYGPEGLIANVKMILDNPDFSCEESAQASETKVSPKPIYIPVNPEHPLGPMVASYDDPMGYRDPVEAVSELGQLRREAGNHLLLFELVQIEGPVVERRRLEEFNEENDIEDFPFDLVEEYLF